MKFKLRDVFVGGPRAPRQSGPSEGVTRHWSPAPAQDRRGGVRRQRQTGTGAAGGATVAARERITFAQAYVRVLNGDPYVYVAYLKEQEAKLAAVVRAVAEIEILAIAPEWPKCTGVPLLHLSSDDLRRSPPAGDRGILPASYRPGDAPSRPPPNRTPSARARVSRFPASFHSPSPQAWRSPS